MEYIYMEYYGICIYIYVQHKQKHDSIQNIEEQWMKVPKTANIYPMQPSPAKRKADQQPAAHEDMQGNYASDSAPKCCSY